MPETVCVTVEQLKEWRKRMQLTLLQHDEACDEQRGGICDCGNNAAWMSMEQALGQAERLKDWRPHVGDLVRLKAKPETVGRIVALDRHGAYAVIEGEFPELLGRRIVRYLSELMPAEGE